ncbi:hydroxymethylglutaryl-CoA synthase [Candidatus Daviesbacteria bacterium]|nr:hydroxymethylglutaryl-CoA synthase [Candidatus Daviesbacteria bacterium]
MTGIVGYGAYVPRFRIKVLDIANAWGKFGEDLSKSLGVLEKAVAAIDEDALTLGVEAATRALNSSQINLKDIEAILVGSESHPFAVNPTATTLGQILNIPNNYLASDLEFACKAGTSAIQLIYGLVESGKIKTGLAIGTDSAQAKPGDVLEYTAGAGAGCFIIGKQKVIANILGFTSYSSNTPDFWRRDGQKYPSHAGRFTGEPAYFEHVTQATKALFEKYKVNPSDFDYAIFHMPNGKFPLQVTKKLGFSDAQIKDGFIVPKIGNPYSASSLLGLASVLDIAKPHKKIFVCSYGSGAGSDAFIFETTKEIINYQKKNSFKLADLTSQKTYLTYPEVIKMNLAKGSLS